MCVCMSVCALGLSLFVFAVVSGRMDCLPSRLDWCILLHVLYAATGSVITQELFADMDKYLISNKHSKMSEYVEPVESMDPLLEIANRKVFGNTSFRTIQRDVIEAAMRNEDIFVVLPTGGGKSLCYQLPATLCKGVTVVISPLLSLVEDQVSYLIGLPCGGIPAAYLSSASTVVMIRSVFQDLRRCQKGVEPYLKLLYVTPERMVKCLETRRCLADLYENEMLARFVVDEAHCVSSWGHDFRKDYGKLGMLRSDYPEVPITALTATARKSVAEDTLRILNISQCLTFGGGFDRPNLKFEVCVKPPRADEVFAFVLQIVRTYPTDSTGIVYCMTKKDTEQTADYLRDNGVSADYYHAGMTKSAKSSVQAGWLQGRVKVVCATIAYGMGIDKADVRFVVHASIAKSLEGYYQVDCSLLPEEWMMDVGALERIMLAPPKRALNSLSRLEEMAEYCTNVSGCRRETFASVFGADQRSDGRSFQPCGDMCDNCLDRQESISRHRGQLRTSQSPRHMYTPATNTGPVGAATARKRPAASTLDLTGRATDRACFATASGKAVRVATVTVGMESEAGGGSDACGAGVPWISSVAQRNGLDDAVRNKGYDCRSVAFGNSGTENTVVDTHQSLLTKKHRGVCGGSKSNSSRQAIAAGISTISRRKQPPEIVEIVDSDTE